MYKIFAENTFFMKKLGKESFLNIANEKKTEHTHTFWRSFGEGAIE